MSEPTEKKKNRSLKLLLWLSFLPGAVVLYVMIFPIILFAAVAVLEPYRGSPMVQDSLNFVEDYMISPLNYLYDNQVVGYQIYIDTLREWFGLS